MHPGWADSHGDKGMSVPLTQGIFRLHWHWKIC